MSTVPMKLSKNVIKDILLDTFSGSVSFFILNKNELEKIDEKHFNGLEKLYSIINIEKNGIMSYYRASFLKIHVEYEYTSKTTNIEKHGFLSTTIFSS